MPLREMPICRIIELLEAKQAALQVGDLEVLNILKKQNPDLFIEEELEYVKEILYMEYMIKSSPAYKNMQKQIRRKNLICVVNNDKH